MGRLDRSCSYSYDLFTLHRAVASSLLHADIVAAILDLLLRSCRYNSLSPGGQGLGTALSLSTSIPVSIKGPVALLRKSDNRLSSPEISLEAAARLYDRSKRRLRVASYFYRLGLRSQKLYFTCTSLP